MTTKKKIHAEMSSGNVFKDLGLANPEERLLKASLLSQLAAIIRDRELAPKEVAELLSIDRPKVSALLAGKVAGYSVERLFRFLTDLGQDVNISVRPTRAKDHRGHLNVHA
ncbi:MAG: helix-turn-helix domain-containing protein [Myxococcaceae bacterium]|nr:helix-turn-helix domain-containing protein [Myxococcaceae bacterium]